MEFASANPSVVRAIKQRVLLNTWLSALRKPQVLPSIADFEPDSIGDELIDMMRFDIEGCGESARYLIRQEGSRLAATYGNDHIAPDRRTNRYLDDAIGPERYAHVLPCYRTCLERKRPIYSIALVRDVDGKDVSYERLLLPFGRSDNVEQIIGSYKTISVEGNFKVSNLMGLRPENVPVRVVNAVIDLELARRPAGVRIADDIVEVE
jgi:hypothetical protein